MAVMVVYVIISPDAGYEFRFSGPLSPVWFGLVLLYVHRGELAY